MKDQSKTKQALIQELAALRTKLEEIERSGSGRTLTESEHHTHVEGSGGNSLASSTIRVSGINVAWDAEHGTCTFEDLPVAMMWVDTTLAGLMSGVQAMVGTERFFLALQSEGRKSVEADWQVISRYSDFHDGFKAIANIAAVAGWGYWELTSLNSEERNCCFRARDSWEGRYQKSLGVCWGSGMLAGKMAGYCLKLFGTNCWADQTQFIAKGDNYDEFVVTPSPRLIENEIENLLACDEATRADMAVALRKLEEEIAERKRADTELRKAYEQLRAADYQIRTQYESLVESERSLRASEERFKTLFDESTDAQVLLDHEGKVVDCNDAHVELFGLQGKSDVIGHSPDEFSPVFQMDGTPSSHMGKKILTTVLEKGSARFEWLHQKHDPASTPIVTELSLTLLKIANRPMIHVTIRNITARKQAEEALRESEEKYRLFVESASEGIVLMQEGKARYVNPRALEFIGYSQEEIIGQNMLHFVHPDDRARLAELYLAKLAGEEVPSSDYWRIIDKSGAVKWVQSRSTHLTWEGKSSLLSFLTDITDRKRIEESLREREIKLLSIFRVAPVGIGVVVNRVFQEANDMLCEMTGYSREELLGQNARMLYPTQEDYDHVGKEKYHQIVEKGTGTVETRWQKKDGIVIDIILSSTPLDPDDLAKGVTFTALEITDRKQAEGALRESEERFRALSENAPDIIYTMNLLGAITYVNPSWKRILGHDEKDVLGHYFIEFAKEEDRKTYKKLFKSIREEERTVNNYIGVMLAKDGKERVFNMNSAFNRDSEGHLMGVVGSMKDVTELRDIEKKLSQAEKMEAIGTLAGGIAHDFNNILAAILGYTQLAIDAPDEERRKRYLNQVLKSGERAKNLTGQILAFSRQDKQERSPIEIGGIVKEALKLLRSLLPTTIEINQEIESTPSIVLSNSVQIHQVLMNLCTNAAHAMRDKGGVLQVCLDHIQLSPGEHAMMVDLDPGSYIRLIVRDTGHGINPGIIDRIFDPFFTTKKVDEGTGLGLSVAYGIVKSHGGTITVQSEPGKGSTFNAYFPQIEEATEKRSEKPQPILGGSERVLFIDDEPYLADIGKEGLSALGYEVTVRTSSIEALHAFRARPERFDLVITDMTMPNMTGVQLADEILKVRPDIPIILCTGYSEIIDEEKSKKFGIRAFLMKPVSLEEIARTIRKVLNK
jgi:PAS domain S-box-containing protein